MSVSPGFRVKDHSTPIEGSSGIGSTPSGGVGGGVLSSTLGERVSSTSISRASGSLGVSGSHSPVVVAGGNTSTSKGGGGGSGHPRGGHAD